MVKAASFSVSHVPRIAGLMPRHLLFCQTGFSDAEGRLGANLTAANPMSNGPDLGTSASFSSALSSSSSSVGGALLPGNMEAEGEPLLLSAVTRALQGGSADGAATSRTAHDELARKISAHGVELLRAKFPGSKFVVTAMLVPKGSGLALSSAAAW